MARPARLTIVADSGAIYALIDASDAWHKRVAAWWSTTTAHVLLPAAILPEVSYLLQTRIGSAAEIAFVQALADRSLAVEGMDHEDLPRIADIMYTYRDLPLGFVDASVVATAERLEARTVLTTDRRHFGIIRPRHAPSLELVP